ncbi:MULTISPECIES: hypothetical protein [unclassified Anaeromyxobacter]|uniref:hypothetical protein n=1 Tax=unclassified Anaeromyxobacter TaxID=2620896 RepID=UPI001F56AEEA|nr:MULTISPECIES: hypothetical protein [unclassified Anaeromyxobacter]
MRRLALALLAALLATACRSPEERLVDRRRDLRESLDRLYSEYVEGGSGADRREEKPAGGVVGRFVQELDRSHFEQSCLAVGRGERTFLLSEQLEAFLKDAGHSRDCREAARIDADVAALEREVQARP